MTESKQRAKGFAAAVLEANNVRYVARTRDTNNTESVVLSNQSSVRQMQK